MRRTSSTRCSATPRPSPSSGTRRSDEVDARKQEVGTLQAAVGPAQALAAAARADEESYRKQVDVVTMATFESGNLDQLDALLAARSPQDFLDQMSALETISSEYRTVLTTLITKVGEADRAQADAAAAVARAQAAVAEAAQAEQELGDRKRDADARIDHAEHLLRALSPEQRRDRNGPDVSAPGRSPAPASASAALRAAASQLGKPYRWGAAGPGQLRLLRPHVVGVRPGRGHAAAVEQPAGARRHAGLVGRDAARRPRLLLLARSATSASTPATAS